MSVISLFQKKKKSRKPRSTRTPRTERPLAEPQSQAPVAAAVGLRILLSEKAAAVQQHQQVVFRVIATATKGQIAAAVREVYGVAPLRVRTIRVQPKLRRKGQKIGWAREWKKAYVTVSDLKNFTLTP